MIISKELNWLDFDFCRCNIGELRIAKVTFRSPQQTVFFVFSELRSHQLQIFP